MGEQKCILSYFPFLPPRLPTFPPAAGLFREFARSGEDEKCIWLFRPETRRRLAAGAFVRELSFLIPLPASGGDIRRETA